MRDEIRLEHQHRGLTQTPIRKSWEDHRELEACTRNSDPATGQIVIELVLPLVVVRGGVVASWRPELARIELGELSQEQREVLAM